MQADACDERALDALFSSHRIDATIHFAALKAVGESEREPLRYWGNNLGALCSVAAAMQRHGSKCMVFSSSATVYGVPERLPLREDAAVSAVNVYGRTKLTGEQLPARRGGTPTPRGETPSCATSTPWGRTPAATSAKTHAACPTT